jgi:LDH2 family malate/lactate/ureidoglycolate dehydrogenase
MAINIERFMPFKQFGLLMDNYTHSIRKIRKAKGVSRIFLPGEIEFEKEKQSLAEGIEIDHAVADSLNQLLEKVKSPLRLTEE